MVVVVVVVVVVLARLPVVVFGWTPQQNDQSSLLTLEKKASDSQFIPSAIASSSVLMGSLTFVGMFVVMGDGECSLGWNGTGISTSSRMACDGNSDFQFQK